MNPQAQPKGKDTLSQQVANAAINPAADPTKTKTLSKTDVFQNFIEKHKTDFQLVIPDNIKPERIMRLAVSAYKRTPKLMECSMPSVIGAVLESSALGLEINTPLQQAYLVPFKNNKTRTTEAELIIGYRGLVQLMLNHPDVLSVFANTVYKKDHFVCRYGTDEKLEHIESEDLDRGEIKGFYSYAKMKEGAYRFIYLPKAKVDSIRDEHSQSYKSSPADSPWTTDYAKMGRKTAIRELEPFIPKSVTCARAAQSDSKVFSDQDIQMGNFEEIKETK